MSPPNRTWPLGTVVPLLVIALIGGLACACAAAPDTAAPSSPAAPVGGPPAGADSGVPPPGAAPDACTEVARWLAELAAGHGAGPEPPAPSAVPADVAGAARRWAAAVRADADAVARPMPPDGGVAAAAPTDDTPDAAVVDGAIRRVCGPGP